MAWNEQGIKDWWNSPFTQVGLGILSVNKGDYAGGIMTGMNNYASLGEQQRLREEAELKRQREAELWKQQQLTKERYDKMRGVLGSQDPNLSELPNTLVDEYYKKLWGKQFGDANKVKTFGSIHFDKDGNSYTLNSNNELIPTKVPLTKPLEFINTGDGTLGVNRFTGDPETDKVLKNLAPDQRIEYLVKKSEETKLAEARQKWRNTETKTLQAIRSVEQKAQTVRETIADARRLASSSSVGLASTLAMLPATDAIALQSKIKTINTIIALSELSKMRQESPTGGAVGALTDGEREALGNVMGEIHQGMTLGELLNVLDQVETRMNDLPVSLRTAYSIDKRKYGSEAPDAEEKILGGASSGNNDPLGIRAK